MKNLTWPQAAVILAFLGCITALGFAGKETAAIIAVGVAILGGLGLQYGETRGIKENTNGTQAKILEINERAAETQARTAARGLELLEGNQRALVALAHKMGTMTSPEQLELMRHPDQEQRAA